jgi:hypothetical protein
MAYYFRAQLGWAWPIMDRVLYECGPRTSTRTVVIGGTGQSRALKYFITCSYSLTLTWQGGDPRVFRDHVSTVAFLPDLCPNGTI